MNITQDNNDSCINRPPRSCDNDLLNESDHWLDCFDYEVQYRGRKPINFYPRKPKRYYTKPRKQKLEEFHRKGQPTKGKDNTFAFQGLKKAFYIKLRRKQKRERDFDRKVKCEEKLEYLRITKGKCLRQNTKTTLISTGTTAVLLYRKSSQSVKKMRPKKYGILSIFCLAYKIEISLRKITSFCCD